MKLRLSEIIAAHDALKGSTIHTLELAEQSQIFKLNRALNAVVKPATEAREDIIDKLRPSNQEELRDLQSRIVSKKATAEEKAEFIVISNAHQAVIEEHLRPLLREIHEVTADPIPASVWEKISRENKWPMDAMNAVEPFVKIE